MVVDVRIGAGAPSCQGLWNPANLLGVRRREVAMPGERALNFLCSPRDRLADAEAAAIRTTLASGDLSTPTRQGLRVDGQRYVFVDGDAGAGFAYAVRPAAFLTLRRCGVSGRRGTCAGRLLGVLVVRRGRPR